MRKICKKYLKIFNKFSKISKLKKIQFEETLEKFDKLLNKILKYLSKENRHVRVILDKQNFDIDFIKFM